MAIDRKLEEQLIACLEALEQGETPEQILRRYPQSAADLRPFLETASQLSDARPAFSLAAREASRQRLLERATELKAPPARRFQWGLLLRRMTRSFASLALFLVVAAGTLLLLAQSALPGDTLYGAKVLAEEVRLQLVADEAERRRLEERLAAERLDEVRALVEAGRSATVAFRGEIESLDKPDGWTVSGFYVHLVDPNAVVGMPAPGTAVQIVGQTGPRGVSASSAVVESNPTPSPQPTIPENAETPVPAVTPAPSPTITSTPSPTPTPTMTATPSMGDNDEYGTPMEGDDDADLGYGDDGLESVDDNAGPGNGDDDGSLEGGDDTGFGNGDDGDPADEDDDGDPADEDDDKNSGDEEDDRNLEDEVGDHDPGAEGDDGDHD